METLMLCQNMPWRHLLMGWGKSSNLIFLHHNIICPWMAHWSYRRQLLHQGCSVHLVEPGLYRLTSHPSTIREMQKGLSRAWKEAPVSGRAGYDDGFFHQCQWLTSDCIDFHSIFTYAVPPPTVAIICNMSTVFLILLRLTELVQQYQLENV